ncbi:MAG: GNAT family N-acetyltransferase [Deltaproteobacteria bacterium]|nr:GNAT family N-acetyltransferase [Deltaproteobacteria bacterium]MBI3295601.1 GNAT family N-acetyltransferase [Deltaproteobacteria bacterium]
MPQRLLTWDSDHYGFPIARLDSPVSAETVSWCSSQNVRCAYWLIDAGDQRSIEWATENGFVLADVRMTLDHPLSGIDQTPSRLTRTGATEDRPVLVQLSPSLFAQSRFFTDTNFPLSRSQRLYEIWMERSFAPSPNQTVLVTGAPGKVTGLITCSVDNKNHGTIGLYAVLRGSQGQGLGRALLHSALIWFRTHGAKTLSVVTQGRAVEAQRSYQNAGFRTCGVALWFHRWF